MSEQLIATPGTFGENGNFLLERELGTGGMGGVYMGRDKMLDRPVAVKVMQKEYGQDAEFVEKFKKEAQAAAKLIHPNIAQIYSYGICDGMPYIAMELVAGGSLDAIMANNPGKTDVSRVLKICQQVAQALQCSTDQGFVHGDIKPENILLDANGNAKIVDFGLAAMQKDTSEIWGTPYYIAPEKVRKEPIDFRTDMYSLGGTLYHALTGVAPFEGEDSIAVVKKRFDGAPRKPSELRPELTPAVDNLVMTMLAFNKEDRYPSFEALLEAFKKVLTSGLTAKLPAEAAAAPKATGVRRMTVRTRRTVQLKRPGPTSVAKTDDGDVSPATAADDAAPKSDEEDDEEGGNLGVKVLLFIVGGILAIGAVIGGLIWFKVASDNADKAAVEAQVNANHAKANEAVQDAVKKAVAFADEFDTFAKRAVDACEAPTEELYKILPMELSKRLKPATSKALQEAIALTNGSAQAASPAPTPAAPAPTVASNAAPAKAAAPTNAPAATAKASTNAPAAKVEAKAAPEVKEDEPPPQVVVSMNELWERAYYCEACAIRIRVMANAIVKKGESAKAFAAVTHENAEKLAELSRSLVESLDQMKASKEVEEVRKGISYIKSKGDSTVKQTLNKMRVEKLEAERKAKAEAAAEAEKKRLAEAEAKKNEKIKDETDAVSAKFEAISAQGNFRQLDWKGAIRQLETLKADFETAEGQLAADLQIRKINDMKKIQDIFIRSMVDHVFKGKLKGLKVTQANEREITLVKPDGKNTSKITWQKFYRTYSGNLNELINAYVVNGRRNAKPALNLRDWADAMTGAALTMQLLFAEVEGAAERSQQLVQEAVKQFPEYAKTAKDIFPDMTFAEAEE